MRKLIEPMFKRVGYEARPNDAHLDSFLRAQIVGWACDLDMAECTEKVVDDFKAWMDQSNPDREGANP